MRQALHYGLDVSAIIRNLYSGQGKPFSGGLADTDFGYNPALKPYPYDQARARQLLAEAGYPGGIDVILHAGMGTMVNDKHLVEAIADMWAKVGVRAKVQMMEMGARQRMLNDRMVPPNGLLLGNPQSTLLDADGSLWRIWHPSGFNGKYWSGNQPGQRFHDLMEQARYTLDQAKRKQLYTEATQIMHEEKPWLELFQEVIVYGTTKRVSFRPRSDFPADRLGDVAVAVRPMRVRAGLLAAIVSLVPVLAAAEVQVPPGFRVHVYVTGQGLDSEQDAGQGRRIPSVSTLAFNSRAGVSMGQVRAAVRAGPAESRRIWRLYPATRRAAPA